MPRLICLVGNRVAHFIEANKMIIRGSYMVTHVLLSLLKKELATRDKMQGLSSI